MQIIRILTTATIILAAIVIFVRIIPKKSLLKVNHISSHFPVVTGYNLERRQFEFPRDFAGEFNLVILPFQRIHQDTVDTWVPAAQQIEADIPGFFYYEMPTLTTMSTLYRAFLNEGMRAGIPDPISRERTITLYLDKERFRSALEIPSENKIHLLLVDAYGKIMWRTTGEYTPEKAASLVQILRDYAGAN